MCTHVKVREKLVGVSSLSYYLMGLRIEVRSSAVAASALSV